MYADPTTFKELYSEYVCSDSTYYLLDQAILASSHAGVFANPDHRLDRTVMRSGGTVLQKELRFDIGAAEIKYARFLLLATSEEMVSAGRDGHRANDVVMRERVKRGAVDGIPDLAIRYCQ